MWALVVLQRFLPTILPTSPGAPIDNVAATTVRDQ
jgi:hypothetical protein